MRKLIPILSVMAATAFGFGTATAQEPGSELTLRGCLAQMDDDGEVEYVLQHVDAEGVDLDSIDLVAADDVNLAPHVGHTVEVSGTVMADEDDSGMGMEEQGQEGDEDAPELRVTALTHISGSCSDG